MNEGFSYYFCMMIEGSGSGSIPLTSGSGSGRPNFLILWHKRYSAIQIMDPGGQDIMYRIAWLDLEH